MELKSGISLYNYQKNIVNWMKNTKNYSINGSRGGILYVDMGLGKTFTTLEYLRQTKSKQALIVCSKILIDEWISQINKFYEKKPKIFVFHSSFNKIKDVTRQQIEESDIVLTTYHMISRSNKVSKTNKLSSSLVYIEEDANPRFNKWRISDYREKNFSFKKGQNVLHSIKWDNVICDESQNITNWKTSFFQSIYVLNTKSIFGLSGTPIKNNKKEFITTLKMLKVNGFNYPCEWKDEKKSYVDDYYFNLFYDVDYKTANITLPKVNNIVKELDFNEQDKVVLLKYIDIWNKYMDQKRKKTSLDDDIMGKLIGVFTRLRQISLDKILLVQTKLGLDQYIDATTELQDMVGEEEMKHNLTFGNAKSDELKGIFNEVKQRNEKVIVFSSFTTYLKMIVENIEGQDITFIESVDSIPQRRKKIEKWKKSKDNNILIMNYRIGAEGLNLVEANNVVLLDTWWNFTYEKQAIARCHRIGQTKSVNVYRLLFKNSIETLMFNKSVFKSDIFGKIQRHERTEDDESKLSAENMDKMVQAIKLGLQTIKLKTEELES